MNDNALVLCEHLTYLKATVERKGRGGGRQRGGGKKRRERGGKGTLRPIAEIGS